MKYFNEQELTYSRVANSLDINNWPREDYIWQNLINLVNNVLDPAREKLRRPIYVNSAYRSPETNIAVGGAKNSQHMLGEAADIYCEGDLTQLLDILKTIDYDQLLYYPKRHFIHVSYTTRRKNRKEFVIMN